MKTMNAYRSAGRVVARRHVLAAVALAALGASLSLDAGASAPAASAFAQIGASLPVAQFDNSAAAASRTWSRASGFASVLAGQDLRAARGKVQVPPAQAQFHVQSRGGAYYLVEGERAADERVVSHPGASDAEVAAQARAAEAAVDRAERIRVLVDNDRRDLLAINGAVADDFSSTSDIGQAKAQAIFNAARESLVASHLIANDSLAMADLRAQRLMQGERLRGGPVTARVKEYLFEVPHAVGGIEVFGAATTVAVHRSGQIASIRTTGPVAAPAADRSTVTRAVSAEALASRARSEHPNAKIESLGLRYPWHATQDAALAARPHEAFLVTPLAQVEGRQLKGRVQYIFYSVEGGQAAPLIWPLATPAAEGDTRE